MLQNFTLHTHTNEFDGKNTVAEMVNAATEKGMRTIGISNHFIVHPNIKQTNFYPYSVIGGYDGMYNDNFDIATDKFKEHFDTLEHVAEQNKQIRVLKGMEIDFFDSIRWHINTHYIINTLKPDYTIGSCHFIEYNGRLCNIHDIHLASPSEQHEMLKIYWDKVYRAIKSGMFTFIAHLDLPLRLNLGTESAWKKHEQNVVHALSDTKTPVEINTALYNKGPKKHPHPSPRVMDMIYNANVPVILSDDAHSTNQIGRYFDKAKEYVEQHNIHQFCELHRHILKNK